ncbi:MAG: SDR family oxidoreductase [Alphaproteobacteria bacterium]|nr:SDR family oxidoreductase [Alphaproteobacteria bacterium]
MSGAARTVLVTGAGGAIGGAVVRRLRDDGVGVIGTDRGSAPAGLPVAQWIAADLATAAGRAAVADLGAATLDGFVHCAGVFHTGRLADITDADWDHVFAVNAKGPLLLFQRVVDRMAPGSAAVFVASIAALRGTPDHLLYAASKAALRSLAASLALGLAERQIRVNCLCPGLIDTPMTDAANAALAQSRGVAPAVVAAERAAAIPSRRAGTSEEVAGAVSFLLSRDAAYMTGATLTLAGGLLAGAV